MFSRLSNRLFEKDYATRSDFNKPQQDLLDAMLLVQKSINKLNAKLAPLKVSKKALTPDVMDVLHQLDTSGVRVGKILMYLRGPGMKDPTAKDILAAAGVTMSKQFLRKLEQLVLELQKEKPEELVIKNECVVEGFKSFWYKIKSLVSSLDRKLRAIENMLHLNLL